MTLSLVAEFEIGEVVWWQRAPGRRWRQVRIHRLADTPRTDDELVWWVTVLDDEGYSDGVTRPVRSRDLHRRRPRRRGSVSACSLPPGQSADVAGGGAGVGAAGVTPAATDPDDPDLDLVQVALKADTVLVRTEQELRQAITAGRVFVVLPEGGTDG